ncbi:HIRAN domain-containing protein [Parvicella tangerina]|uniref:HIRAN domain-containing protein n=1 Tax=Parvicella tangerina TaxID=2829795 RepID=A0A916JR03_9FLAO|nr:HIRAN domain-containing protein [Parvicella tangerina]CAG5087583.1 hypothetical protein CRYO30217_03519 [Parvicella tangerina]
MRKYNLYNPINQPISQPLPKLGILTHVEELTRYDLIYVAHKMQNGVELSLKRDESRSWDENALAIHYKGFKIGYVSKRTSEMVRKLLDKGKEIKATVKSLSKNKFLPTQEMDIQIYVM